MAVKNPTYVVFDAECVLCNAWVKFILEHEQNSAIYFAARQSAAGMRLARDHNFSLADLDQTYLVIEGGQPMLRSDAAFALLAHLASPYRWLRLFRIVPRPLRDGVYNVVARNRYRWFGRQMCFIPTREQRNRFLDD